MKSRDNIKESLFKNEELTRHAFDEGIIDYIFQLTNKPNLSTPNNTLKEFGINGPKALEIVMDENIPYGPLVTRSEKIKTRDDGKDNFHVKYTLINNENNFYDKMAALYKKYIENNSLNEKIIKECEGGAPGGATAAANCNATAPITPMSKPIKRKTIYITEKQLSYIKENFEVGADSGNNSDGVKYPNDFTYTAPGLKLKNNEPALNHQNMIKKSINEKQLRRIIRNSIFESLRQNGKEERYVEWNIFDVIDDNQFDELVDQGIIPQELGGDFNIGINVMYNMYDATNDIPGDAAESNREFFGNDYNEALRYINQIQDNYLKNKVMQSLNDTLYSDDYTEGSNYLYSDDDFYQDKYDWKRDNEF